MDLSDDNSSTPRAAANGYAPAPALASDDNATNRRKSVRVVRKPKLFVQEPIVTKSAKRKRAEVQVEDDASGKEGEHENDDDDDEEEDEESEGEADVEELKERKRKNATKRKAKAPVKPAAKKVKKTRAAPAVVAKKTSTPKSANGPTPKARRGRAKQTTSSGGAEGLYGELFMQLVSKNQRFNRAQYLTV
jgi:cohesin complex subunit SA-1/2